MSKPLIETVSFSANESTRAILRHPELIDPLTKFYVLLDTAAKEFELLVKLRELPFHAMIASEETPAPSIENMKETIQTQRYLAHLTEGIIKDPSGDREFWFEVKNSGIVPELVSKGIKIADFIRRDPLLYQSWLIDKIYLTKLPTCNVDWLLREHLRMNSCENCNCLEGRRSILEIDAKMSFVIIECINKVRSELKESFWSKNLEVPDLKEMFKNLINQYKNDYSDIMKTIEDEKSGEMRRLCGEYVLTMVQSIREELQEPSDSNN